MFVLKQANTACRQQMTTEKLFHKHFNQLNFSIIEFQDGIMFQLNY